MNVINETKFRESIKEQITKWGFTKEIGGEIENNIYDFTLNEAKSKNVFKQWNNTLFVQIYIDKLRSFFLNILNNPLFLGSILNGELVIKEAVFMTHQEINPQRWKSLIDKKVARDKCMYETKLESSTDTFRCRKCQGNHCSYFLIQTRSADEPMTTFITCLDCGNRWKC